MKTNFHNKNFALSLAFIMRFKAARKWSIAPVQLCQCASHSLLKVRCRKGIDPESML